MNSALKRIGSSIAKVGALLKIHRPEDDLTPKRHWTLTEFAERWFFPNVLIGEHGSQPSTINDYRKSLAYWREATGDPAIEKITAFTLAEFQKHLRTATYKRGPNSKPRPLLPFTIAKHIRQISTLLCAIGPSHDPRRMTAGVAVTLPYLRKQGVHREAPKKPFQLEEARSILKFVVGLDDADKRVQWVAFLSLLYFTAARFSAALRISPSMISDQGGRPWLTIPGRINKTKNAFAAPLHADVLEALAKLPRPADDSQPYFNFRLHKRTLDLHHREFQRAAGMKATSLGWHAWRRTHAVQIEALGFANGQIAAQIALDHSSRNTTRQFYCDGRATLIDRLPRLFPEPEVAKLAA